MAASATVETPPAPPSSPESLLDVELPEGMSLEDLEKDLETAVAPPEEPAPAPAPAATAPTAALTPATPAPETPKPKGDVTKALRAERRENKRLRQIVSSQRDYAALVDKERAQGLERMGPRTPTEVTVSPVGDTLKANADALLAEVALIDAQLAQDPTKPVAVPTVRAVLKETERMVKESATLAHRMAQEAAKKTADQLRREQAEARENELREELADAGIDYDETLRQAGVLDGLAFVDPGMTQRRDPAMGKIIYSAHHPPRRAFVLATQLLRKQGKEPVRLQGFEADDEDLSAPAPAAAAPAAPAPAPAAPGAVPAAAEARREGAREVVETIERNSQRPRGVRVLRNAGGTPQVGPTPELWDAIDKGLDSPSEQTRERWLGMLNRSPDLNAFYERGRPK